MSKRIELKKGEKFGRWKVLEPAPSKNGATMYKCQCKCGTVKDVCAKSLKNGKSTSCGCIAKEKFAEYSKKILPKNDIDITGEIFGNIRIIEKISGKGVNTKWKCECLLCGKLFNAMQHSLSSGSIISCGCANRKASAENVSKYVGHVDGTTMSLISSNKIFSSNTSGVRGVSFSKKRQKYVAYICFKGKLYNLGFFDKLEDAAAARKKAEEEMYIPFLKENDEKLALLTEKQKDIYLRYESGMTVSEIADELGTSRQNISATIKISERKVHGEFTDARGRKVFDSNSIAIPPVKVFKQKRVITPDAIDKVHHKADGTTIRNFFKHKTYFIENLDFFVEHQGDSKIFLFTETGYLMLSTPSATQRTLRNKYFRE